MSENLCPQKKHFDIKSGRKLTLKVFFAIFTRRFTFFRQDQKFPNNNEKSFKMKVTELNNFLESFLSIQFELEVKQMKKNAHLIPTI